MQSPSTQTEEHLGKSRLQRGVVLGLSAVAIGLLTTFSGVFIELASDILADLRHGVCVERLPGDTRPLWAATLGGGWRPYDRMRCCGGSSSVDHASQECRALSIITHSTHKRFAKPLHTTAEFGHAVVEADAPDSDKGMMLVELADGNSANSSHRTLELTAAVDDSLGLRRSLRTGGSLEAAARAAHVLQLVGADAARVREHISHVFGSDPTEPWAEEERQGSLRARGGAGRFSSLASETAEVAVNAGIVQTQSESAGSLAPLHEWVPWERALPSRGRSTALLIYVVGSGLLAFCAALVTWANPSAKGSGIPEVKASVAGFDLPRSFHARTLAAKVLALPLCVGAGMAVGKEGPMIHIGACWGVLLSVPVSRLGRLGHLTSPIAETELICVGAAAGVAATFGAPLAGVLFAVEELGTTMPTGLKYSTMLCAFGSAVVAALALKWLDLTRTQRLTLFEVDYKEAWAAWEAIPFCLLGILGGLLGGAFVLANEAVHQRRLRAQAEGHLSWCLPLRVDWALQRLFRIPAGSDARVFEVVVLAVLTGISNYPHALTRMLQNDAMKSLFSQCPVATPTQRAPADPVGLCGAEDAEALVGLLRLLFGAAMLRFVQSSVTFGALTPAGLFVPSLYMGGCVGRAMGALLKYIGMPGAQGAIEPGIYAMVGAGAMLAGVSRLTLSLAVVLFELTGGLTYVVPFMLSVLIAKWTGDLMTDCRSVYDVHAEMNGLAKVEQAEDMRFLGSTLQDLGGANAPAQAEGGSAAARSAPPALWTSNGLVSRSDLAAHCRSAGAGGFAVLSAGPGDEVEVLGWACAGEVLRLLALTTSDDAGAKAERWLRLAPRGSSWRWSRPTPHLQDFSEALEVRGVVRVRSDCPAQTACCIFQRCPAVHALVAVDGTPPLVRTVTRELFAACFVGSSAAVAWPTSSLRSRPACGLARVRNFKGAFPAAGV